MHKLAIPALLALITSFSSSLNAATTYCLHVTRATYNASPKTLYVNYSSKDQYNDGRFYTSFLGNGNSTLSEGTSMKVNWSRGSATRSTFKEIDDLLKSSIGKGLSECKYCTVFIGSDVKTVQEINICE
jgi:hypothetical protein